MHAMLSNDYKRNCMAAGAPAAFQSENTRVRPPIIDLFHVRSSSTARHTKCNSRQTRRGSASPQSAHTSSFFLSRSESGAPCVRRVRSSNKHCVAIYCPISTRFTAFFHKGLLFQMRYLVRIFVARWRHNFREIAVKNFEKSENRRNSLCTPFRIDS